MRVLHVVTTLSGGGAERFVASTVPRIAARGHAAAIMTIDPCTIPTHLANDSNVELLPMNRRGRFDPGFIRRAIAAIRRFRPDVVHAHMHAGTYWGRLAAMGAGVRCIVRTEHLPCDRLSRAQNMGIAERVLNAASASIVTFFEEQARFLAQCEHIDPTKMSVIPNGIDLGSARAHLSRDAARSMLGLSGERFAIVVLANLHRHKNQRLAIEALAELDRERRAHARILFVGRGHDQSMLEGLAVARGVRDVVEFLGFRDDVPDVLAAADLMLMPSLTEGMPLALLEGMSAGVPVLSTPWTGVREMLRHGDLGDIAPDFSASALARAIAASMSDRTRIRAQADRAQLVVHGEYGLDTCVDRHLALYESLLTKRAAA